MWWGKADDPGHGQSSDSRGGGHFIKRREGKAATDQSYGPLPDEKGRERPGDTLPVALHEITPNGIHRMTNW